MAVGGNLLATDARFDSLPPHKHGPPVPIRYSMKYSLKVKKKLSREDIVVCVNLILIVMVGMFLIGLAAYKAFTGQ